MRRFVQIPKNANDKEENVPEIHAQLNLWQTKKFPFLERLDSKQKNEEEESLEEEGATTKADEGDEGEDEEEKGNKMYTTCKSSLNL